MKRYYDSLIEFTVVLANDEITLAFSSDWKFTEMLDYVKDTYSVTEDDIVEIRNTFIKRYKIQSI